MRWTDQKKNTVRGGTKREAEVLHYGSRSVVHQRKRRTTPQEKWHFFLGTDFLVNKTGNPTSNFTWKKACFLSTERFKGVDFSWIDHRLWDTPISGCFATVYRLYRRVQRRKSLLLAWFNNYGLHLALCEIWSWVIHHGLEERNRETTDKKLELENETFLKSDRFFKPR